jgi:hypothetical protein
MQSFGIDVAASSHRSGCLNCPEHGEYILTATGKFARVPVDALTGEEVVRCTVVNGFTVRGDELVQSVEDWGTDPAPELRAHANPSHPYCTAQWFYKGEVWISRACPSSHGLRDLVTNFELSCCDKPPPPNPSTPSAPPWVPDCEAISDDSSL